MLDLHLLRSEIYIYVHIHCNWQHVRTSHNERHFEDWD